MHLATHRAEFGAAAVIIDCILINASDTIINSRPFGIQCLRDRQTSWLHVYRLLPAVTLWPIERRCEQRITTTFTLPEMQRWWKRSSHQRLRTRDRVCLSVFVQAILWLNAAVDFTLKHVTDTIAMFSVLFLALTFHISSCLCSSGIDFLHYWL